MEDIILQNRKYHKIQTIYKRDDKGKLLLGKFSLPEFEYLYTNEWEFTEKMDGTNIRVVWDGEVVNFYGRSNNAQIPPFLINKLQLMFPVDAFTNLELPPMILFGEGVGARIQKIGKKYIPDDVSFMLFDVFCGNMWLRREDVYDIANRLNIKSVSIVGYGNLGEAEAIVREGFHSLIGDCDAEGLVCRPTVELLNRRGFRIIAKIKHKDFKDV